MRLYGLRLQNPNLHYVVIPIMNEDCSISLNELQYYRVFNHIKIDYKKSIPVIKFYKYPKKLYPEKIKFYPSFIVFQDIRNASFWSLTDLINSVPTIPSITSSLILGNEECEYLGEFPDIDNFSEYFFRILEIKQPSLNHNYYDSFKEDCIRSWVNKFFDFNRYQTFTKCNRIVFDEDYYKIMLNKSFKYLPIIKHLE